MFCFCGIKLMNTEWGRRGFETSWCCTNPSTWCHHKYLFIENTKKKTSMHEPTMRTDIMVTCEECNLWGLPTTVGPSRAQQGRCWNHCYPVNISSHPYTKASSRYDDRLIVAQIIYIKPYGKITSLAPGKFEWNFRYVIFKRILVIDGCGISCEIALIWMSLGFTDDQSTLFQVMAWWRQISVAI